MLAQPKRIIISVMLSVVGVFSSYFIDATHTSILGINNKALAQTSQSLQERFPNLYVLDFEDISVRAGNFPYSTLLIMVDNFSNEEKLMVLDKNFRRGFVGNNPAELGFLSVWSYDKVAILEYGFVESQGEDYAPVREALVSVDGEVFQLPSISGNPGTFAISSELRQELISSNGSVAVRVHNENGDVLTFEIGEGTINAYKELNSLTNTLRN